MSRFKKLLIVGSAVARPYYGYGGYYGGYNGGYYPAYYAGPTYYSYYAPQPAYYDPDVDATSGPFGRRRSAGATPPGILGSATPGTRWRLPASKTSASCSTPPR